ncbi:hypothetical protein V2J09_016751 [Rumex salicifolius]
MGLRDLLLLGVLLDLKGEWIVGFIANLGTASAIKAELWSVFYGLKMAWKKEAPKIHLAVDFEQVLKFLKKNKGNKADDALAKLVLPMCIGFHMLNFMPLDIRFILLDDANGESSSGKRAKPTTTPSTPLELSANIIAINPFSSISQDFPRLFMKLHGFRFRFLLKAVEGFDQSSLFR